MSFRPTAVQTRRLPERMTPEEAVTADQERRRVLRARAPTWAGIIGTGVLLLIAMRWYPGEDAGVRRGYPFSGDFLSTLGRTRAGSWDNTVSCLIFNGTLLISGPILAVFWRARAYFLTRPGTGTILRGCGLTMSFAMAGIGLAPCDLFPHVHDMMTYAAIVLGVVCFTLCFIGSHREFESVQSKLGWLSILVMAGVAQALFIWLISIGTISSSPTLPLMQKLFVLLLALWAGWQAFLFGSAPQVELPTRGLG